MPDAGRILVISSFPPRRCGIGSYAAGQVRWLRDQGAVVETLGLGPDCEADRQVDLQSPGSMLRCILTLRLGSYDEIFFNYTDGFLAFPASSWPHRAVVAALQALLLLSLALQGGRRLRLISHEITCRPYRGRLWEAFRRIFMGRIGEVQFHTESERTRTIDYMAGWLHRKRTRIVAHARHMTPHFAATRREARRDLNLPQDRCLFLCIGYLTPHKGFDRAVRAIDRLPPDRDVGLYLVGSLRTGAPEQRAYRDQLAAMVAESPRVTMVEAYQDDRSFDAWLRAADAVVLPYRGVWSSGVGARARMLGTAVVASALPNFESQFAGDSQVSLFHDDDELILLLDRLSQEVDLAAPGSAPAQY